MKKHRLRTEPKTVLFRGDYVDSIYPLFLKVNDSVDNFFLLPVTKNARYILVFYV